MHPKASESKDWYDDLVPPRWGPVLELYGHRTDFFHPFFQRDIVPTQEEYIWNLVLESNGNGPIVLSWNTIPLQQSTAQLLLYDEEEGRLIHMKQQSAYTIAPQSSKQLKIIYSYAGEFIPNRTMLGKPYPNPASSVVKIPIVLGTESETFQTRIDIFDLKGIKVRSLNNVNGSGFFEELWDGMNESGQDAANGIYIIKMMVNGRYLSHHAKLMLQRNE
jgi:hypothetical protein